MVRLLAPLAALAVAAMVAVAPAAAAETGGGNIAPAVSSVLTPGQTGASNPAQWGGWGGMGGSPAFGNPFWPWWAGMPLTAISAATGFTWPGAPWYWTPQWWAFSALTP
jgi:hypothetical protein